MFVAKFKDGNYFKKVIDSIKDLVSNANFEVTTSGIQMQAMDASHVALVALTLKEAYFSDFRTDRNFPMGIKLVNLNKILKCAGGSDIITLECECSKDPSELVLKYESPTQDKLSMFSLNLINLDSESLTLNDSDYACTISMSSAEFGKICKELSNLSENVKIETSTNGTISFSVVGDVGSGSIELKENNSDKPSDRIIIKNNESISNNFSLTFLNIFNKAGTLSETVNLYISENAPLVIEYKFEDYGVLKYYLAPRLNDDN